MSQRRMFSPEIVCSEEFLDMPPSSRELYFQLGMRADDDGFIQPRGVMRMTGATQDELKLLLTKRFLLPFETGVVVIKHWLIHNMIRADRYKPTRFIEEKKRLYLKDNKAYTDNQELGLPLLATIRQPNDNQPAPQVRLGKGSLGEETSSAPRKKKAPKYHPLSGDVLKAFEAVDPKVKTMYANTTQRKAASFLVEEYGIDRVKRAIELLPAINQQNLYVAQITTPYELQQNWVKLGNAYKKRTNQLKEKQPNVVW